MKKTYVLMIMDGFGLGRPYPGNAISLAYTPTMDYLDKTYPHATIDASELSVGLPPCQMGNSEVGHLNLGAGRVVYQELTRISKEIDDGGFFQKEAFLKAIENVKTNGTKLHLIGLVSDGGVHSHIKHLFALLSLAKRHQLEDVYIHVFLDGRDTPPQSGVDYLQELENFIEKEGIGTIATLIGRFYSMDRDHRWERSKLAYDAMVEGKGQKGTSPKQVMLDSYEAGIYDEFIIPTVLVNDMHEPRATIDDKDSIIFFNFRPDRGRQLTEALSEPDFSGFKRGKVVETFYVTMTEYDSTMHHVEVAYRNEPPINTLGEYLSKLGKTQLRTAETEKYPHVTFFFNGGREEPFSGEERILIPSPKVATYDMQPEMSAREITKQLVKAIKEHRYDLIVINYANCDMVGHTGNIHATVKAVETVDQCVGEVVKAIEEENGVMIITADHGNAEYMLDDEENMITSHTTNPVPVWVVGAGQLKLKHGKLADLAPTMLQLMNIEQPDEMTGMSIIEEE